MAQAYAYTEADYCSCVSLDTNRQWYDCPVHPDTDCYVLVCEGCLHSYPDCGLFEGEEQE